MLINDNWKIESDGLNITLFQSHLITGEKGRKSNKIGEFRWQPVAYLSDFRDALDSLVKRDIKGTGLIDYKTVVKKIDELYALIKSLNVPREFTK